MKSLFPPEAVIVTDPSLNPLQTFKSLALILAVIGAEAATVKSTVSEQPFPS